MRTDRFVSILCCILLLLAMILSVPPESRAATTKLTLQLPESYTVDLNIRGQGSVWLNGTRYTHSASVKLERLSNLQILVIPDKNSRIQSVVLNGEKQDLNNGQYALDISALTENITLEVRFRVNSIIPDTGDSILIPVGAMLLSGISLILICKIRKKVFGSRK